MKVWSPLLNKRLIRSKPCWIQTMSLFRIHLRTFQLNGLVQQTFQLPVSSLCRRKRKRNHHPGTLQVQDEHEADTKLLSQDTPSVDIPNVVNDNTAIEVPPWQADKIGSTISPTKSSPTTADEQKDEFVLNFLYVTDLSSYFSCWLGYQSTSIFSFQFVTGQIL